MKSLILILTAAVLAGCSTLPGHIETTTSKFDGEQQVQIDPGWLPDGIDTSLEMGGFWSDKYPSDFVLRIVHSSNSQFALREGNS